MPGGFTADVRTCVSAAFGGTQPSGFLSDLRAQLRDPAARARALRPNSTADAFRSFGNVTRIVGTYELLKFVFDGRTLHADAAESLEEAQAMAASFARVTQQPRTRLASVTRASSIEASPGGAAVRSHAWHPLVLALPSYGGVLL